jgi:futalosine hydrolase
MQSLFLKQARERVLFCAATAKELATLRPEGEIDLSAPAGTAWETAGGDHLLVTGVGSLTTMSTIAQFLYKRGEQVDVIPIGGIVQIGIAGVYRGDGRGEELFESNALLRVVADRQADVGAWDDHHLLSAESLGFSHLWKESPQFLEGSELGDRVDALERISSCTVEASTGSDEQANRRSGGKTELETLEGAAAFASAIAMGIGAVQLRAVSNLCGPRDRSLWRIDEALQQLHLFFADLIGPIENK